MKNYKKLPESELETMLVVWHSEIPVRGSDLAAALFKTRGWNKSTVFTLLLRLVDRGFLSCSKEGKILDRFYAGSIKNFVAAFCSDNNLSKEELEQLRQLVDEQAGGR